MTLKSVCASSFVVGALVAGLMTPGFTDTKMPVSQKTDPLVVRFEFDKANIKAGGETQAKCADIGQEVKNYPFAKIEIDAYADSVGTETYNQKLSADRAEA